MIDPTRKPARWGSETGLKLRRRANRKLKQRRALRSWLRPGLAGAAARRAWHAGRKLAPVLVIALVLALAGVGLRLGHAWATTTPRFALLEIETSGHTRVTRDELLAAAGLGSGDRVNILTVSTRDLEAGLERHPWVAEARVSRRLPHTLRIELRERRAAAMIVLDGSYLVDERGWPFKRAAVDRGEADGLVVVTGLTREAWLADPATGQALVQLALAAAAQYRKNPERPAIGEVHLSRRGLRLYTVEGALALELGRATGDELGRRLERFDLVWTSLSDEEKAAARTIHLDSATRRDRVTVELDGAR